LGIADTDDDDEEEEEEKDDDDDDDEYCVSKSLVPIGIKGRILFVYAFLVYSLETIF
jgi:hypothetical protein